ncbi:MAG: DnaA/Hda family protein [Pseudomonadota bacterium]
MKPPDPKQDPPEQLVLPIAEAPSLQREDLVVSDANRAAIHLIDTWPDWISPVSMIVGDPGAGKTHILTAWRSLTGATLFQDTNLKTAVTAAQAGAHVAIDDLAISPANETVLFHLINAVRQAGTTLFATGRNAPDLAAIVTPDLASRLRAATIIAIEPPDDDLLRGVMVKLFADRQLAVDDGVIDYAIARMARTLRAATELVAELDTASMARKRRVSTALVREVLQRHPPQLEF